MLPATETRRERDGCRPERKRRGIRGIAQVYVDIYWLQLFL